MFSRETGNVYFNRHGSHTRPEIEETASFSFDAEPVSQITSVCDGCWESDDSQLVVGVGRDEVGSGDDNFENGAAVLTEQMDFVNDYQPNSLK